MNNVEIWKDVVGLEEYAEVSSLGKVRTKDRIMFNNGTETLYKGRDRVGTDNGLGYLQVRFNVNGKVYRKYIHRMVAEAFVDGVGKDVNHIDGNKKNNNKSNLEWCSRSQNIKHALDIGLLKRKGSLFISPNGLEA